MMRWLNYIWVALLLVCGLSVKGQDAQGGVIIHSDPRLAMLVRKPHNEQPVVSNLKIHKPSVKHIVNKAVAALTPKPNAQTNTPATTTATTTAYTTPKPGDVKVNTLVTSAAYTASKPAAVKINNDEASTTGRAGGWSPPPRRAARVIYSGKGFRVQIYNGPDREKAIEIKTEFMRNYPGMRTYLSYVPPCFRVKVGNYRTRNEALGMLREANSIYTPCMIVPDLITISTF